jgi:predicted metalloprotease with PDZ domain
MTGATPDIRYRLSFPDPPAHLAAIEMEIPVPDPGRPVTVWMPVWTPGSYLVREYSRHVQDVEARDSEGKRLTWTKEAKNRWRVDPAGASRITVRYRVYGRELSVRTNWFDGEFALVIGAATFLAPLGMDAAPRRVEIEIPRGWGGAWTALEPAEEARGTAGTAGGGALAGALETGPGEPRRLAFTAPDLDTLIDSPVLCGSPAIRSFDVDGVPFTFANLGEGGLWDGARAARDLEAIVRVYARLYRGLPFDRYLFLNLIVESRGGLEHRKSCVTMTSRYAFRRRKAYRDWLGLMSHEFFHVWNVKRSRPAPLGPFDYERENYTRSLWVAEGVTTYYTDLAPRRAGLITEAEYLEELSDLVGKVQGTPGRLRQSLEDASFDAWIKHYRPDENSANSAMSYYLKGGVAAWLLDAELRTLTGGRRSLDDLMRLLFREYSGERGYTDAEIQSAAEEVAGTTLAGFFARAIRGREELDYEPALRAFGLRFRPATDGLPPDPPAVWLGMETRGTEGRLLVASVLDGGPARESGLDADDEILAVGGYRVTPATFTERLQQFSPGERVEVLVSRRDAVRAIPVTLAGNPGAPWRLEPDPAASADAVRARERWLTGD